MKRLRQSRQASKRRAGVFGATFLAVVVISLRLTGTVNAQTTTVNSLVFDSDRSGRSQIYRQDLDANQAPANPLLTLTTAGAAAEQSQEPEWSLTASAGVDALGRVIYQFGASGVRGIYVVKPDGISSPIQLTPQFAFSYRKALGTTKAGQYPCQDARDPSWSPDGLHFVYACLEPLSSGIGSSYDLWVHDTNGTPDNPNDDADYPLLQLNGPLTLRPAWSPSGSKISYVTNVQGVVGVGPTSKIAVVPVAQGANGIVMTGPVNLLTDDAFNDISPTWSPDSQFILFSSNRESNGQGGFQSGSRSIWRMSTLGVNDTANLLQLTNGGFSSTNPATANDTNPAFSTDGKLAFGSDRGGKNQIYVIDAFQLGLIVGAKLPEGLVGVQPYLISDGTSNDQNPTWKPRNLLGIDIPEGAGPTIPWDKLKQAGVSGVMVETKASPAYLQWGGTIASHVSFGWFNQNAGAQLQSAQTAGLLTGAYVFLTIDLPGGEQVSDSLNSLAQSVRDQIKVVAIDVEINNNASFFADPVLATQRIVEALDAIRSQGKNAVIYTNASSWSQLGSPNASTFPLWEALVDNTPDLTVTRFPTWPRQGKQYSQTPVYGVGYSNADIFDPLMFAVSSTPSSTASGGAVIVAPVDTSTGSNPVVVKFSNVVTPGQTTLTTSTTGLSLPLGFKLGYPPTYYDIMTTAGFIPPVEVCINYANVTFGNPASLHLWHYDNTQNQSLTGPVGWVDLTLVPSAIVSNDTVAKTICATVASLSPFAILEPLVSQAIPTLTVTGGTFPFDGAAHGANAVATGVNGGPVSGSFAFTYTPGGSSPPVNVGTYTVTAQFTSNDANYTNASSIGTITISPVPTQTPTTATTGSMQFARVSHQATLLADGLVLVSGGQSGGTAIAHAELFNPATGTWSLSGSNVIPRFDHTATPLVDGRVLATGGVSSTGDCTSNVTAETYDPAKGTWSLTGRLPSPVGTGHIAVVLLDGRVLVSGGGDRCGTVFNTAAIFDPSTSKWSATGNMTAPREFHSAALLSDGRVLVAGGATSSPFPVVASAEIYDPKTGLWTAVSSMGTARQTSCNGYTQPYLAGLSGGTVLAAGGFSGPNCSSITPQRTVSSLTVSPSPALLSSIGQTLALTVTAHMSDASTQLFTGPLQFNSADATVATVDSNGLITSVGAGTTTITVTASGIAPVTVTTTVATRALASIVVSPPSITLIGAGQTQPLAINGQYSDGSQQALTTGVTFASSNTAVATVDATGLVTSAANGTATITVSTQGAPAVQIPVTVKSLVSIAASPTSISFNAIGQVQAISVTGLFTDGSQQILTGTASFLSSNPTIARVDLSGNVTAINFGTATITVALASLLPVQVPVTVTPPALSITKTHTGDFTQGQQGATYTITVSNMVGAGPTSGMVTVTETLPSGLTLGSMSGAGWLCGTGTTCTRSDALAGGTSYSPITVTVNVASTASSPQVNAVTVAGGGSAGASATDSTTINPGQHVRGHVFDAATGSPISTAGVGVYDGNGNFLLSVAPDATGVYQVDTLAPGSYYVRTFNSQGYVNQVYPGLSVDCCAVTIGSPITLAAGVTVSGIDFPLARGGRVGGRITDATTGNGLSSGSVQVFDTIGKYVMNGSTDAQGNYVTSGGLPAGNYFIRTSNRSGYFNQLYSNQTCIGCSVTSGTPIAITVGGTTTVNFALTPGGGVISGQITDAVTAQPLVNANVNLFNSGGAYVGAGSVDSTGHYVVDAGLTTGIYYASTFNSQGYVDQLYSGFPCNLCGVTTGTPISITTGAATTIDFALVRGGQVSGLVTDAKTGSGLANVAVSIYDQNFSFVASATTGANGNYITVEGITTGTYLAFTSNSQGYIDQTYSGPPIQVTAGAVTSSINFALTQGGRISGQVTDAATGSGLANVTVEVFTSAGFFADSVLTDGSGNYTTGQGLATGTYYARTFNSLGYVDALYAGNICVGCTVTTGTPIPVTVGAITSQISFALGQGGRISGQVTDAATGNGLARVRVEVYTSAGSPAAAAFTDVTGNYVLGPGLPTGTYYARTFNSLGYLDGLYAGTTCVFVCTVTTGTPITVTVGATTSGIGFSLTQGGQISGQVTDAATSNGLANITVEVFTSAGSFVASASADAAGNYRITRGLPTGSYFARTFNSLGYVDGLYSGQVCVGCAVTTGTPIVVTAGTTTSGINFALIQGGRISGQVTDATTGSGLAGVTVDVYTSTGSFAANVSTGTTGNYSLGGLPAGSYYARTFNSQGYVDGLYSGQACVNCTVTTGTPVVVSAGSTTSGINFALTQGGRIGGQVIDATTGSGLAGVTVDVFTSTGSFAANGSTDTTGNYSLGGLPAGNYYARTFNSQGYVDGLYSGQACVNCAVTTGTPIVVTAGTTTSGINFALTKGGQISGRVTDAATGNGLANVTVEVFTSTGFFATNTSTDSAGNYVTNGIATGAYYARTFNSQGYVDGLYSGRACVNCTVTTGTPVVVTVGTTTSAINFALARGGQISGRVTDVATGNGLANVTVEVFTSTGFFATNTSTDATGSYTVGEGLPAGTYYARTFNSLGYVDGLYSGQACVGCAVTTGTPIVVTVGTTTSGINFALAQGGKISGQVTDAATGSGLAGVTIQVYTSAGFFAANASTDATGNYTIGEGLPAGTYYARTFNSQGYVDGLYSGQVCANCNVTTGTPISVTAGAITSSINFSLH